MSGEGEEEVPKTIPALSKSQEKVAYGKDSEESAIEETFIFNSGDSARELKKQAESREASRSENFKDNFERVSIIGLYFLSMVFIILTSMWALHLILPKNKQFLDENQEDKLQLIITGGFVAGLASSHLKKRLGG